MRKPFWKKSHKSYYCEIGRKQIRLGPDKEAADQEYHRLMAGNLPVTSRTTVQLLADDFLAWTQQNRAEATYEWYRKHLQSFVDFVGPKLRVSEMKAFHVSRWLARDYSTSGSTHQNGACRAVSRCFNWARKQGLISANPVADMERPAYEPREAYLNPEQWEQAITLVKPTDPFFDLIWFLRESGSRPQESRIVEAKHWDRANKRLVLERKNSKGKKQRRVIRLNEGATEVVARLALKNPNGPLFRNARGKPWKAYAINNRFRRMEESLGFEFFPYILRHSWTTDALLRGVDPLTVAIFLGHKDASMVMKVYNHLIQQDEFLQQKLRQATGEDLSQASQPLGCG